MYGWVNVCSALLGSPAEHKRSVAERVAGRDHPAQLREDPVRATASSLPAHIQKHTLDLIAELQRMHGIDYEVHDGYRFVEKGANKWSEVTRTIANS